jgi:hypothetical protein
MEKNPLNLQKGTFFILGRFSDKSGNVELKAQYAEIAKKLELANKPFIKAIEICDLDASTDDAKVTNLKERASYLAMCDVVVTINDWASDEDSKALVTASRLMGKHIAHGDLIESFLRDTANAA